MRTLLKWIILLPVAAVIIVFAVVNRHDVKVVFDPTGNGLPGLTFDLPLYLILFSALILGVLIGGVAAWLKQSKHRKAARAARNDARKLADETQRLRSQMAANPALASPTIAYTGPRTS